MLAHAKSKLQQTASRCCRCCCQLEVLILVPADAAAQSQSLPGLIAAADSGWPQPEAMACAGAVDLNSILSSTCIHFKRPKAKPQRFIVSLFSNLL